MATLEEVIRAWTTEVDARGLTLCLRNRSVAVYGYAADAINGYGWDIWTTIVLFEVGEKCRNSGLPVSSKGMCRHHNHPHDCSYAKADFSSSVPERACEDALAWIAARS